MRLLKWLDKHLEHVILAALLMILTALSFFNVVLRYAFRSGISWSDELCRYCLILSGFFSIPCWIRYQTGIKVDAVTALLPKRAKGNLTLITNVIMIAFLGFMCRGTWLTIRDAASVGQKSPALQMPMVYLYDAVMVAFVLAIIRYLQVTALQITGKIEIQEEEAQE